MHVRKLPKYVFSVPWCVCWFFACFVSASSGVLSRSGAAGACPVGARREWSVRLRAPDSGYEWVADVEDRQAFHMGKYQVSGTFRRQRDA